MLLPSRTGVINRCGTSLSSLLGYLKCGAFLLPWPWPSVVSLVHLHGHPQVPTMPSEACTHTHCYSQTIATARLLLLLLDPNSWTHHQFWTCCCSIQTHHCLPLVMVDHLLSLDPWSLLPQQSGRLPHAQAEPTRSPEVQIQPRAPRQFDTPGLEFYTPRSYWPVLLKPQKVSPQPHSLVLAAQLFAL